MAIYSTPNTFSANTLIKSADVNSNFSAISTAINTTLCNGGNAVYEQSGGTNQTSYTLGDILYASATNTLSKLPIGSAGQTLTVSSGIPAWASSSALNQSTVLSNLGFSAAVSANLLSVALKQADGSSNPSSTAAASVSIGFRSSTLTSGAYAIRTVTGALSISTVATGCTLGTNNSKSQYIYVYALDNAGTVELALAGTPYFDEGILQSTTIINGSSTSAYVLYSTTARTNVAVRLIGRLLSNQPTAGTYTVAPTELTVIPFTDHLLALPSEVILTTGNGHGSTNNKIRKYTTIQKNQGSDLTLIQSAGNGDSVTVNVAGWYSVQVQDCATGGAMTLGASVNSSQLTTSIISITAADRILQTYATTANGAVACSDVFFLNAGDIIRSHDDGTADTTTVYLSKFRVCRIS